MLTLFLSLVAAAAPCDTKTQPKGVAAEVEEAMLAWAALDEDGFDEIAKRMKADIACLSEPLSTQQAAGAHRVFGLQHFLLGDEPAALASLQAAALAAPGYTPSERIAPEGSKLWRLFDQAAKAATPVTKPLEIPPGYDTWVDGARTVERAMPLPAIVQVATEGQSLRFSAVVPANQAVPLPELPVSMSARLEAARKGKDKAKDKATESDESTADDRSVAVIDPSDKPSPGPVMLDGPAPRERTGKVSPLWYGAVGTGVGAAGLFAASAVARNSFDQQPTQGKFNTVNGAYFGSIGMAAVTAGLVGAALATR